MIRLTHVRLLAAALLLAASTGLQAQAPAVTIHDAWLRETMGNRNTTGAFAIVENPTDKNLVIVAASSDVSDKVELHEMKNEGGMMQMAPVAKVPLPAHGKAELKPGSFHVMLFDMKKKPADGDKVKLTLTLDDGTKVTTDAVVRKPAPQR